MLTLYQRDALGNFLTVLTRNYRNQFSVNLWDLFDEYKPNKDFTISGAEYYKALKSILYPDKMNIVFKLISTFNYMLVFVRQEIRTETRLINNLLI